jgi:OmpA-OmpF porin, OOP family
MRRSAYVLLSFAAAALAALPASAVAAETVPSLDLRGFRPSTDPAAGLYLEPASSPATLDWNVGAWLSYIYRPITLRDPVTDAIAFDVIRHQLSGDLAFGIGFGRRVALGLDVPFVLYQTGDDPTDASMRTLGGGPLPRQALGDIGITGKLTILKPTRGDFGGFAVALHGRVTAPTGDEASYVSEGHVTSETRLLTEFRVIALGVHFATGVKLRAEPERFACATTPAPPEGSAQEDPCPTRFGHEVPYGLGVSFRPQVLGIDDAGRWTWFLEFHGHLPIAPAFANGRVASANLGAGARLTLRDVSIMAGLETSVVGAIGGAPIRGLMSVGWAPRVHDVDGDGVDDDRDECRELAEDKDGFEDQDGCPDGDNDDDGVPDGDDRCATEREDEDGTEDDDGCIDPDNDGDKVLDAADACPDEAGPGSPDAKKNGCPVRDPDGDGIEGEKDKCPEAAEDKDSFEDDDGCPEADNDTDGVPDAADACPLVEGIDSPNPKEKGCPDPDRDRDTLLDAEDKCPGEAEVWNGVDDGDGCPEGDVKGKGRALVEVKDAKEGPSLRLVDAIKFTDKNEVDAASMPLVRALASEAMKHPEWTVVVGVRPKPKGDDEAKARAGAIAGAIQRLARREKAAEAGTWSDVKDMAGAAVHGIGLKVKGAKAKTAAAAEGEKKAPAQVAGEPKKDAAPKAAEKKPAPKKP